MKRGLILLACSLELAACHTAQAPATPPQPTQPAQAVADPDVWREDLPTPGVVQPIRYPTTERSTLASGLTLLTVPRRTATLSLEIACNAGSAFDPIGQAGISALTARMLEEGTPELDAEALAIRVETLGANLDASSNESTLNLRIEVLPESADAALAIFADVLLRPAFRAADLKRVKREWLDHLALQREDSATLAQLVGRSALLGRVAGSNPLGTPREISPLTPADLKRFHQRAVNPARCALLAAGPITSAQLQGFAEQRFAKWKSTSAALERRIPQWPTRSRALLLPRADAVQTSIYLANQAPSRQAPGHEARRVIDNLFGGLFTSRINLNLREAHAYTYGASSRLAANPDYGIWSIQTDVKSEVTSAAIAEILKEHQTLLTGPLSAEEVARSKTDLVHGNAARLSHTNALLSNLEAEFSQGLAPNYFAELEPRIVALSAQDLQLQLAQFRGDTRVLVLVGPAPQAPTPGWLGTELEVIEANWLDNAELK